MSPTEIYTDLDYADVWDRAHKQFLEWLEKYIKSNGYYPDTNLYTQKVSQTAKKVLDAIAQDDVLVEEHIEILCDPSDDGYNLTINAVSSIGDTFLMIYAADGFERC